MGFESAWPLVSALRGVAIAALLTGLTGLAGAPAQAQEALRQLRPGGPNAQALGQAQGYPSCLNALQDASCRVGA